jgi:hypothetical protein
MAWATLWATFSQTHSVTLVSCQANRPAGMKKDGIQTRKRKSKCSPAPKEAKQKHAGHPGGRAGPAQPLTDTHQIGDLDQIFLHKYKYRPAP